MNLHRLSYSAFAVLILSSFNAARADDLNWSQTTGPLFFYDTAGNWTPSQSPTDADNVTFSIPIAPTPNILIGSLSNGLNVNVLDNDWVFTGAPGANLDTEGSATIDDALGTAPANGSILSVNAAVNWDTVLDLVVGDAGYGTLNLEADADFRGRNVYIGNQLGSVGEVNVDGMGTMLQTYGTNSGDGFIIGNSGTGTLNVTGGGLARIVNEASGDFNLGLTPDGEGTLNIDGSASSVIAEDVFIGDEGTGHVNISNGGFLNQNISTSPDAFVAQRIGSSGDVTVHGDGSEWRMARLEIGNLGDATLSVEAGGFVRSNSNDMVIADAGGSGKVAVFGTPDTGSGANISTLEVVNDLYVGSNGLGELRVGVDLGANLNLAPLGVGHADLNVSSDLLIGSDVENQLDNIAYISGLNTTVTVGSILYVGENGKGALELRDGSTLTAAFSRIGSGAMSHGTLGVTGTGTTMTATTNTVIGTNGIGNAMVSNGAILNNGGDFWVGYQSDANGTLTIDNSTVNASTSNTGNLQIGGRTDGSGGTGVVTIQNGGTLKVLDETYIGGSATSSGKLIVTGAGSNYFQKDASLNDLLRIGYGGEGLAEVRDGGRIDAEGIVIGSLAGSAQANLLVTGSNSGTPSTVDIDGFLYVGDARRGTMTVEQGAQVHVATSLPTESIFIGDDNAADGSKLTITGVGSRVNYFGTGDVSVGNNGGSTTDRATLEVADGGVFSAVQRDPNDSNVILSDARIIVGDLVGGNGHVIVKDPGSRVEAEAIYLGEGDTSSSGILDISNGGAVELTNDFQAGSNGNGVGTVNVDGLGSLLDVGTSLALGDDAPGNGSATGNLKITEGGTVTNGGQAYVGHFNGSFGVATLESSTANTSTWTIGGDLILAGTESSAQTSGSGVININSGGLVDVGADLIIRNLGDVNLGGGELRVPGNLMFLGANATMNFNSGTLRFNNPAGATLDSTLLANIFNDGLQVLTAGKHLAVDGLAVISSPLRVNGGTLSVGNISVANMQNVDFDAGTFNLTNTGLEVANAGLFGSTLVVGEDQSINVATSLLVQAEGMLSVARGSVSAFGGVNSGTAIIAEGTITVDSNFINNGELVLIDATINGNLSNNGDLTVFNTVAIGSLELSGSSSSSFAVDGNAGSADLLDVAGNAQIGGALNVAANDVSSFTLGQQFDLIIANNVVGTFSSESLPILPGGLRFDVLYESNRVALAVVNGVTSDGDFDNDGDVDGRDFLVWQRGDSPNGINSGDLAIWQTEYGMGAGLSSASANTVPEPSSLLLLAIGICLIYHHKQS